MDREKVIKGVHDARRYLEDREWVDKNVGVHIDALNDALALLKEQEAIEPVKIPWLHSDGSVSEKYRCGSCDLSIFPSYKFCPFCGQAVKWE